MYSVIQTILSLNNCIKIIMILLPNYAENNTLYEDGGDLLLEHQDSGVSKVAIKVANFDWSVIMIITTLFLCILYVCGFALLCLKAISSLGDNNSTGRDNLISNETNSRSDFNVNFGNIHNQISGLHNSHRRDSSDTLIVEWYEQPNST